MKTNLIKLLLHCLLFCSSAGILSAQVQTRPAEGLRSKKLQLIAYKNATLVPEPGKLITNATVIIRNDRIEAAGQNIAVPAGAVVRDASGLWIYPAFVEPFSNAGMKKPERKPSAGEVAEEMPSGSPSSPGARHWNDAVHPEQTAASVVALDETTAESFRKLGFGAIHVNSTDGIMRGSSALVLAKPGTASDILLKSDVAQWMSFRKGSSRQGYPSSMMGSIALIRQTLLDAQWYGSSQRSFENNSRQDRPEINLSLAALSPLMNRSTKVFFETNNEHSLLRFSRIAKEFSLDAVYAGNGTEYRRLPEIAALKPTLIIPLNFPAVPDLSQADRATDVSLGELLHWDAAPSNAALLDSAGISFALTTSNLTDRNDFWKNLRMAVQRGLAPEKALAALTTIPAQIIGADKLLGTLEEGKIASMIIADGDIFKAETKIRSVLVAGEETNYLTLAGSDIRGRWSITLEDSVPVMNLRIAGSPESPQTQMFRDTLKLPGGFSRTGDRVSFSLRGDSLRMPGTLRFTGVLDTNGGEGRLVGPDGREMRWRAVRDSIFSDTARKATPAKISSRSPIPFVYPFGPYGYAAEPEQKTILLKDATIWTSGPSGILTGSDILIRNGKIAALGRGLTMQADTVIRLNGKHISPGIIDEHSHIAIEGGVNEGTHAVTAEVRIGDVVYPDDINIYRQLSGGVTSSHLLHGSANPIGGQLQLIKLRWGQDAEDMKFHNVDGTIKFALGENVKQANWGERYTTRYPQTRMGVEEIMRDGFRAALEYERKMSSHDTMSAERKAGMAAPRRDLQLETLLEIMHGKRHIHCHSYVQSEILMLIRLAEEFNFKVKNFTHILEGYKVAREMAAHGTSASSFADWWAYKFEVYDAIPQNAAIMAEQGVLTSINSDDAEMARRLNQEAAKSVKYGGMSEEEALKMVTINPARQLNVADRTGSLEIGKDADIVVWSGNPLSNFSRVEQTYVDGRKYFDLETDTMLRRRDAGIRAMLEQKALDAAAGGEKTASPVAGRTTQKIYHCDDMLDEMSEK